MAEYIKNNEFRQALIERKALVDEAKATGKEIPVISDFIATAVTQICTRFSYKANWINYTYRDEMVQDAIMNCIRYLDRFDVSRANPHAYFTKCAENSFKLRIKQEKNQSKIKAKMVHTMGIEFSDLQEHDSDEDFSSSYSNNFQQYYYTDYDVDYSTDVKPVKEKPNTVIEDFLE